MTMGSVRAATRSWLEPSPGWNGPSRQQGRGQREEGEQVIGGFQGTLVSVSADELFSFLAKEIKSSLAV